MIEAFIGKPWSSGAQGPEAFDCYGLVRAVLRECCGIDAPMVQFDASSPADCLRAVATSREASVWREIDTQPPYSVVLLGHGCRPHHVGIVAPDGRILHSIEGAGVLLQPLVNLRVSGWRLLATYEWAEA